METLEKDAEEFVQIFSFAAVSHGIVEVKGHRLSVHFMDMVDVIGHIQKAGADLVIVCLPDFYKNKESAFTQIRQGFLQGEEGKNRRYHLVQKVFPKRVGLHFEGFMELGNMNQKAQEIFTLLFVIFHIGHAGHNHAAEAQKSCFLIYKAQFFIGFLSLLHMVQIPEIAQKAYDFISLIHRESGGFDVVDFSPDNAFSPGSSGNEPFFQYLCLYVFAIPVVHMPSHVFIGFSNQVFFIGDSEAFKESSAGAKEPALPVFPEEHDIIGFLQHLQNTAFAFPFSHIL